MYSATKSAFHRLRSTIRNHKKELFACVRLPGEISGSTQQRELDQNGTIKKISMATTRRTKPIR